MERTASMPASSKAARPSGLNWRAMRASTPICCRMEALSRGVIPMFGTLLQPVTTPLCAV